MEQEAAGIDRWSQWLPVGCNAGAGFHSVQPEGLTSHPDEISLLCWGAQGLPRGPAMLNTGSPLVTMTTGTEIAIK